jgi:transcriptional regulator with XRE-family HTH domain
MISNSRQASVSRKRREELLRAAEEAPSNRRSSYLELANQIGQELEEYEAIRRGAINVFSVREIDDLGEVLVKARLAKGWTQRQLAEALQVSEQMVQKDESKAYENAGLARIAEVADVLGYNLKGAFQPVHLSSILWRTEPVSATTSFSFETSSSRITPTWVTPGVLTPLTWAVPGYAPSGMVLGIQPTSGGIVSPGCYIGRRNLELTVMKLLAPVGAVHGTGTFNSASTVPMEMSGASQ